VRQSAIEKPLKCDDQPLNELNCNHKNDHNPLRASVHFDRYWLGLLMKNFSMDWFILVNIPSKWCYIIQATFVTSEFLHYGFLRKFWVLIKLFEFEKLWEIFDKSSEHYKNMLYFSFKIFFQYMFQINEKTPQNNFFNFSTRWPHIFNMLFKKPYDMVKWFLVKNYKKYFEKLSHFSFKNFQTNFFGILSLKYWK
jgi:hypothetical protein